MRSFLFDRSVRPLHHIASTVLVEPAVLCRVAWSQQAYSSFA